MGLYLLCLSAATALMFPLATLGQSLSGGYLVEIQGTASPSSPTVTIRVSASWDPHPSYLWFAQGWFDFHSDSSGTFSEPTDLPIYTRRVQSPWSLPGVASGNEVTGVLIDQRLDTHSGWFPLRDNPLPIWEVRWTTQNFTPRWVPVCTTGREGIWVLSGTSPPPMQYVPASAIIRVVPAPATIAFMLGGVMFAARRRQ